MRRKPSIWLEGHRIKSGPLASDRSDRNNGAFEIPTQSGVHLFVIASDGAGWEHVSVSLGGRCPTWDEMCYVKRLFWKDDETVVQYHPAKGDYVNCHPFCLHLWRPKSGIMQTPPPLLVGPY